MLTALIKSVFLMVLIMSLVPVLIWWERKGSAYIQDRRGPNRANIFGIRLGGFVHNLADAVKLLFKEEVVPDNAHRATFVIAPVIVLLVALTLAAVVPFSAPIEIGGNVFFAQAASLNIGILYILAISSLSVYGIMLAGWSAGSAYPLLGGVRASAQLISYEVPMGLAVLSLILWAGTVRPDEMVALQGENPLNWYFVSQPLSCIIFFVALFAETNRNPFDIPEGESEIVAGYHTEYSSMKFAMFFMAEYAHIVAGSMIFATLFFGGYQVPFVGTSELKESIPFVSRFVVLFLGLVVVLVGALFCRRRGKFGWGDIRDNEPLFGGIALMFLGGLIIAASFAFFLLDVPEINNIMAAGVQFVVFMAKTLFFCWLFIWVRWTLPRFRYDQLMKLGWKVVVPLAVANLIITVIIVCHSI
jgi:NADH-quinone oxidoreductase subunit H